MSSCKLYVWLIILPLSITLAWGKKNSQEDVRIPEPVLIQFDKMYPEVSKINWKKENDHYIARFRHEKKQKKVSFTEEGKVYRISSQISIGDLPKKIQEEVFRDYRGYRVAKIHRTNKEGYIIYELVVVKGKERKEVHYTDNGNFIQEIIYHTSF